MTRHPRTSLISFLSGCAIVFFAQTVCGQENDRKAQQLADIATNAQNANDPEVAAAKWDELINDYPNYSQMGKVQFNCGKCYMQLGEIEKALTRFEAATKKLSDEAVVAKPEAFLYLGFCQSEIGQQKLATDPEEGKKLITTSTQTFARQLDDFPDFQHNDQVCYFQGAAFEQLGRLKDAAGSYEKLMELEGESQFRFDGLFALANVYEQLGVYDKALKRYREYMETGSEEAAYQEVRFRTAETLMQMANAARETGNDEEYQKTLREARDLYASVSAVNGFELIEDAKFQQAICSHKLGELRAAADQFSEVAAMKGAYAERAGTLAGRDYFDSGVMDKAEQQLSAIAEAKGKYGPEAAHFLAQTYLQTDRPQIAFKLAGDWLQASQSDQPYIAELMHDKADAAYLLDDQRANSPSLYLAVADQFPDHRLADMATYNAAFAFLEIGDLDKAIETADRFVPLFGESEYMPDLLEVAADAELLKGNHAKSDEIFTQITKTYQDNPKNDLWTVRAGLAKYMNGNYDDAIEWLSPAVEKIEDKTLKAEALHWIGSSHLAKEQFADAETTLKESNRLDPKWRLAAETMFALSQAQMKLDKSEAAQQTITAMRVAFPEASQIVDADYRIAETAYESGNFQKAINIYKAILVKEPDSEFAPYCLAGLGWSHLQLKSFDESEKAFTGLLDKFSDTDLAAQALLGRGMSRRQNKNVEGAAEDLLAFVSANPKDPQIVEAKYELGLAQINLSQKEKATNTFEELLKSSGDHRFADRFSYELAWLYVDAERKTDAIEQFAKIVEDFPDSDLAPEANFQVGENLYQAKKFDEAIASFLRCRNSGGTDSLREKAAYRLGWCYYRTENFEKAAQIFDQQANDFKEGQFIAEALVMKGESLYNLERLEEAYEAYSVAKPVMETSAKVAKQNQYLTFLHGAIAANHTNRFREAVEFADSLMDSDAGQDYKLEGWYEKGVAHRGLKEKDAAVEAFENASESDGKIGAKAKCMLGDMLFIDKNFDDAILKYKEVIYAFGGNSKDPEVDPWQAYAIYHAARCSFVRISTAAEADKPKLINDAEKLYENLLENYSDDKLADDARKDLKVLKQLQQ